MNSTLRLIAVLLPLLPAHLAGQASTSITRSTVQVPEGATVLSISVKTSEPLKLYIRYGQPVATDGAAGYDYAFDVAAGQSSIELTPQSRPPLRAGVYYIACSSSGQGSVSLSVSVSNTASYSAAPPVAAPPVEAAPGAPSIAAAGVVNAASFAPEIAAGSFVTIYGQDLASQEMSWQIPDGHTLPTTLGGVSVRINGKDCFVNYVSPKQVNVLAPPDTALGTVLVELSTPRGTARSQATMLPASPGFFTYALNGKMHPLALFANSATFVAQAGAMPGVESRPARPGDILQLYANGLGQTNPPYPAGEVLKTAYPVEDLSRLKATIGDVPAEVLFAGMTFAGVFQVNLRVPDSIGAGDLPVVLSVDGRPTQREAVLTFAP